MAVKRRRRRASGLVIIFALLLAGCTYAVPMNTVVPDFGISTKVPLRATVLIPETLSSYMVKGIPHGFAARAQTFEFPLGAELEKATRQAFAQVFHDVHVVREHPSPKDVEVLVEPEIISFQFWFDALSFGAVAVSKIRVKVTVTDGTVRLWTREAESPEERSGPYFVSLDLAQGEAASNAIVSALKEIASEAVKAPELWKLAEELRAARQYGR